MSGTSATLPCGPKFTTDWFATNCRDWETTFDLLQWDPTVPHRAIEVGSFEGASACWMLTHLLLHPQSELCCIDTFEGSPDHTQEQRKDLRQKFEANLLTTGRRQQVAVWHGRSAQMLADMVLHNMRADLIYVDGSHIAIDVLTDLTLAWELLKPGGILIADDYLWSGGLDPKRAIDAFMSIVGDLRDDSWYHKSLAQMWLFKKA